MVLVAFFPMIFLSLIAPLAAKNVYMELAVQNSMYVATLLVGTPQSSVTIAIDTGLADLILANRNYDFSNSTTFVYENDLVAFQYASTSEFDVQLGTDSIGGRNFQIEDFVLGVTADVSDIEGLDGVLGICYSVVSAFGDYDNFPLRLENTSSNIYSLDGRTNSPSMVFGGLHADNFVPPLYKTPIVYQIGHSTTLSYHSFVIVTVDSVKMTSSCGTKTVSSERLGYMLDTGSTVLAVTEPVYENIKSIFSKMITVENTTYFAYEEVKTAKLTFDVTGINVLFPLADIVDTTTFFRGQKYASLQISTVSIGDDYVYEATLPNAVFKYIYTVFDLDNNQVLFAEYAGNTKRTLDVSSEYPVATATPKEYKSTYSQIYEDLKETLLGGSCRRI